MYNTLKEVLLAVRGKYEGAEKLSQAEGNKPGCFYDHKYNGIGCAIGCLYPADVAKEMDNVGAITCWNTATWKKYQEGVFGPKIERDSLAILQGKHDCSQTVEEFRLLLDHRIETGHWMGHERAREQLGKIPLVLIFTKIQLEG